MNRKKWLIGGGVVGALVVVLLLGGLATGALSQASTLFSNPVITADEAKAAVLEAYPGTNAVEAELEREHGNLVYEVELDNGLEVLVDADTGAVLGLDQEEGDEAADDTDDVQDEFENEVEDADKAGDVDDVDDAEDADDLDDVQDEVEDESDDANEPDKADEIAPASTGITSDDARAIAQEAYPGATVLEIEFDRAGGVEIFEAELDNGSDVRIDAHTGEILGTDIRDND
jgi:uncharacterized membrane protein YkoI